MTQKGVETQNAAERGDSKILYSLIRKLSGTPQLKHTDKRSNRKAARDEQKADREDKCALLTL